MFRKGPGLLVIPLVLFFLGSCIGSRSDITLHRDGSGSINMEYRVSRAAESLGKQGGNEAWPPLPVGREDFERTLARTPGLRLRSFKLETGEKDLVYKVKLDFSRPEALLGFLDAPGQRARWMEGEGLALTLGTPGENPDPAFRETVAAAFEGYEYEFRFTLPGPASLRLSDGAGREREPPRDSRVSAEGNRASFSCPMAELLVLTEPLVMEIRWQ
jgi:hypothetical protein